MDNPCERNEESGVDMGKVNEYASGRADGLQMALRLVEEGGLKSSSRR